MVVVWSFPNVNWNCLLKPVGGFSAAAGSSFFTCSAGKLRNAICNITALLSSVASVLLGWFFPSGFLKEKQVCVHVDTYPDMCEKVKAGWKMAWDKKQNKTKKQPLRRRKEICWEREQEKVCWCLKDSYKPTKGAFWKDVYFEMFISQGNSEDERVEQVLMFPRFWANDKFHNYHIDELQCHLWLYPLNSNKSPNPQTHTFPIYRAGNTNCL